MVDISHLDDGKIANRVAEAMWNIDPDNPTWKELDPVMDEALIFEFETMARIGIIEYLILTDEKD